MQQGQDDEMWLLTGLMAGVDGRPLEHVLRELSEPLDAEIRALERTQTVEEEQSRPKDAQFDRMKELLDDPVAKLSGLLERAHTSGNPLDRYGEHADGRWIAAAIAGTLIPAGVVFYTRLNVVELVSMLLVAILVALTAYSITPSVLTPHLMKVFSLRHETLRGIAIVICVSAGAAWVLPDLWVIAPLLAAAGAAGLAVACIVKRRSLTEPWLSDVRSELQRTRILLDRVAAERSRLADTLLYSDHSVRTQLDRLNADKQRLRRKVTEGYHLGRGWNRAAAASAYETFAQEK